MKIENELTELYWQELAKESIKKDDLNLVDLDIAFSPVIPIKGERPHEVIETVGGGYLIPGHAIFNQAITAEELKVMRYRYLLTRKNPFC